MSAPISHFATTPASIEDVAAQARKGMESLAKGCQDAAALGQANVQAVETANTILVKGLEDLGRQVTVYTQSSVEKAVAAGQDLMSAKSPQDLLALQTSFAQRSMESMIAEGTRMAQLSAKLVQDAFAPIAARVEVTIATVSKPLAA